MTLAIGLELGDAVVRAAAIERRDAAVRLTALAELPWSPATDDLTAVLRQLRKALPITAPVVLGLPSSASIVATVQPLIVSRPRAELALQFELQQHLPYDAAQAAWHYQWLTPPGAAASARSLTTQAVVAAIKQDGLASRVAACRQAGISVSAVSVNAIGAANLWLRAAAAPGSPAALLRLDPSAAEWIVITPGGLHVVPILLSPESLSSLTAAGARAGAAGGGAAGTATIAVGAPSGTLVDALEASWMAARELLETQAVAGEPPAAVAIRLIGGCASKGGLGEELGRRLSISVEPLDVARAVTIGRQPPAPLETFAVACGLALQAAQAARVPVDVRVGMARQQRMRLMRQAAWTCGLIGIVAAGALTVHGLTAMWQKREAVLANLTTQEQAYQSLRPEIRAQLGAQAQLEERLAQVQDVAARRALLPTALERSVEALPPDVWLTKLELSKDDASVSALIEGFAPSFPSVTQFKDALKLSVGWAVVKPLSTTVKTDEASGKERIAFAIQSQQPLPAVASGARKAGDEDKASKPVPKSAKRRPKEQASE